MYIVYIHIYIYIHTRGRAQRGNFLVYKASSVPATVNYPVRGCRGVEGRGRKAGNSAAGEGRGRGKAARAK